MPTNKEAAVLLQKSVKRLQKYTVEDIELALYELSCHREECLRTFIDCNKNFKRLCRFEKELKKQTEMAQLKEEANNKMAAEYKKMATENEKLIAENNALRTKNEELTKEKQQMMQRTGDDERARKGRSPGQGRKLSPASDTVVTSTSTSTPNSSNGNGYIFTGTKYVPRPFIPPPPPGKKWNCPKRVSDAPYVLGEKKWRCPQRESDSKSRITKKPWTPVAKKKRRLLNKEICQEQQQENVNATKEISVKNAPPVDLDNSNANEDVAPIVSDDELAPLEILMEDEEKEEKVKKDHPIIININTVLSQQAFSSPNGTDTTTSSMMLTDLNEHHDSGFMENATNKQQDDADDADAERVISYPLTPPPPPPASPPSSPPPPPPPPPPLSPSIPAATATHPFAEILAQKFLHFLNPFTDLIHNYQAFDLEAAIDVFCRYNIINKDFENRSPQEMEAIKGVLRQIAILDIQARKRKQIKEEAATSDDF